MKNIFIILLSVCILAVSCKKDEANTTPPTTTPTPSVNCDKNSLSYNLNNSSYSYNTCSKLKNSCFTDVLDTKNYKDLISIYDSIKKKYKIAVEIKVPSSFSGRQSELDSMVGTYSTAGYGSSTDGFGNTIYDRFEALVRNYDFKSTNKGTNQITSIKFVKNHDGYNINGNDLFSQPDLINGKANYFIITGIINCTLENKNGDSTIVLKDMNYKFETY